MFYFAIVFLVVCVFLSVTNRKDLSTRYFIGMMLAYTAALLFMMVYLAKDTYYNNIIENYFSLPLALWETLMFLPFNKEFLICAWNLCYCLALGLALCFSLSFGKCEKIWWLQIVKYIALGFLGVEYVIFHPLVQKYGYEILYPSVWNVSQLEDMQHGIHVAVLCINELILALGLGILIFSYRKVTPLKMIRHNMMFLVFNYVMITSVYQLILGRYPAFLMKVSKTAGVVLFRSIEINDNKVLHTFLPYYLMGILLLSTVLLYRYYRTKVRMNEENASFSRQVDASDTTSKVFCHYMKNELLAIQYELEELAEGEAQQETLENAIFRCRNLYDRLDKVHSNTKKAELYLQKVCVPEVICHILENMKHELSGFTVVRPERNDRLLAMVDENYFEQAMHNILQNALDAMQEVPKERKELQMRCEGMNNWITILVKDRGNGMTKEQVKNIFKPFYSSHTVATHWGVGMTLAHKVISAHDGYIEVESTEGEGTIVKIMLPLLRG